MSKANASIVSSFWNIYNSLSKADAAGFIQFTNSVYFNSKKVLSRLAECFHKHSLSGKPPVREEIYAEAFGSRIYNAQVMNNYLTELKHLLHQFMEIKWLREHKEVKQFALADMLLQTHNFEAFEKLYDALPAEQIHISGEPEYYRIRMQLLSDEYLSTSAKRRKFNKLENSLYDFRTYYLTETLRMYCELINRKNLKAVEFRATEMEGFISYYNLHSKPETVNPLSALYYQVFLFLQHTNDDAAYKKYKALLTEHIAHISRKTARELCLYGQNHCVKHINLNHHEYLTELFDLYNIMIRENILYEGKYMTQWTFKNYITVAVRIKEYDTAQNFIEQYHNTLLPAVKHDAYHYNLASLYFEKKDHDSAMHELNKIHFNDPIYYLDARSMLLKIYFGNADYEALQSLYHSVRTYLLRNKQISKKQGDLYRNLFLYTYKLARITTSRSYSDTSGYKALLSKLHLKVSQADIANKTWLLERIGEA